MLQACKEIVCGKKIEIPLSLDLLAQETSFQENKTSHMDNVYSGLVVEILEDMINEYDNFCNNFGMLVSNEKETSTDLRVLSSKLDAGKQPLGHSEVQAWSKYHKGMVVFQAGEVEQLNKRLQILEEDAAVIKQSFFSSVEERKKLIREIHQLFQIIHHFLCLQSQGTGEKTHAGALIINPHKVILFTPAFHASCLLSSNMSLKSFFLLPITSHWSHLVKKLMISSTTLNIDFLNRLLIV